MHSSIDGCLRVMVSASGLPQAIPVGVSRHFSQHAPQRAQFFHDNNVFNELISKTLSQRSTDDRCSSVGGDDTGSSHGEDGDDGGNVIMQW